MGGNFTAHFFYKNMDASKKRKRYQRIYTQIAGLIKDCNNPISNMATINAILFHKFDYYFWCGFYQLTDGKLLVGPYQGSLACINLKKDTGVCWAGVNQGKAIIVKDVNEFDGHIACDGRSNSEIVVPVRNRNDKVVAVMDIDSSALNSFDEVDAEELEKIVALIYK